MEKDRSRFPHLESLMNSYFHQDYDIHGETDDEILTEYTATNWEDDVAATVSELDTLLATPTAGLLARFERDVRPTCYIIAQDDHGARAWLANAREILAKLGGKPRPSP